MGDARSALLLIMHSFLRRYFWWQLAVGPHCRPAEPPRDIVADTKRAVDIPKPYHALPITEQSCSYGSSFSCNIVRAH